MNVNYKGVRALVTGHTGFKGSWLASWLLNDGAIVSGMSLYPEPGPFNQFEDLDLANRMRSRIIDICGYEAVLADLTAFQPDIVFHLAAQPLVRRSYADPLGTFSSNVMGTAHVLEAARHTQSVRAIVCVTTDKCYENKEWVWGYRENDPLGGKDPYSASKAAAEIVAGSYMQTMMQIERLRLATARGGNVVGGGDWSEDRLIPDLVRAILACSPLVLRNPGAIRPWQHVLELVRGYLVLGRRLLDGDSSVRGAWNFGPARENEVNVDAVVKSALSVWGADKVDVQIEPSPLPEANFLKLDITKAAAGLDWRPILSFDETMSMTMDWYRRYCEGKTTARDLVDEQLAAYQGRAF